jgi:hypothetical protein
MRGSSGASTGEQDQGDRAAGLAASRLRVGRLAGHFLWVDTRA